MVPPNTGCDASPQTTDQLKPARSTLVSRNVTVAGHRTSVRLEPDMWSGLSEICRREQASMHEIVTSVAMRKQESTSLTAAIRVFVMAYFRAASTEDGHIKAGHGYGAAAAISPNGIASMPRAMAGGNPAFMIAGNGGTRRF